MLTNKEDIKAWLDQYGIERYTINKDMTVDVDGHVCLQLQQLTSIDVQFNNVSGNFYCNSNQLTSLRGCPETVKGYFYCFNNILTSLEFCPKTVGGTFSCCDNKLTALDYFPNSVGEDFSCANNDIINLDHFNCEFEGYFIYKGIIIPQLKDYYEEDYDDQLILSVSYKELHTALLYDKLDKNIHNKTDIFTKKTKI